MLKSRRRVKVKVKGKNQTLKIYDFFEGDAPDIRQLKTDTKADFEKAIHFYFDRNNSDFILLDGDYILLKGNVNSGKTRQVYELDYTKGELYGLLLYNNGKSIIVGLNGSTLLKLEDN